MEWDQPWQDPLSLNEIEEFREEMLRNMSPRERRLFLRNERLEDLERDRQYEYYERYGRFPTPSDPTETQQQRLRRAQEEQDRRDASMLSFDEKWDRAVRDLLAEEATGGQDVRMGHSDSGSSSGSSSGGSSSSSSSSSELDVIGELERTGRLTQQAQLPRSFFERMEDLSLEFETSRQSDRTRPQLGRLPVVLMPPGTMANPIDLDSSSSLSSSEESVAMETGEIGTSAQSDDDDAEKDEREENEMARDTWRAFVVRRGRRNQAARFGNNRRERLGE